MSWVTGDDVPRMAGLPWRERLTSMTGPIPAGAQFVARPDPLAAYEAALADIALAKRAVVAAECRALELRAIAVTHPLIGEAEVLAAERRAARSSDGDPAGDQR